MYPFVQRSAAPRSAVGSTGPPCAHGTRSR